MVYAVGDIHGRLDLLDRLLAALSVDVQKVWDDRPGAKVSLVFLGDYVDRGPESLGVIDRLTNLDGEGPVELVFLKGNHDHTALEFLDRPDVGPGWAEFGGLDTLASYGVEIRGLRTDPKTWRAASQRLAGQMPASHLKFLRALRLSHSNGDYFFAHAGARPGIDLASQSAEDLMWIREAFLDHSHRFSQVVVHGHTPASKAYIDERRIGIDTGAYATGRLTAVRLLDDEQTVFSQT